MNTQLNDIQLSPNFKLTEFLNLAKHPDNLPTPQVVFNPKSRGLFEDIEVFVVGWRLYGQQVEHGVEDVVLFEDGR